jgi:hypothetical protein
VSRKKIASQIAVLYGKTCNIMWDLRFSQTLLILPLTFAVLSSTVWLVGLVVEASPQEKACGIFWLCWNMDGGWCFIKENCPILLLELY